MYFFNNFKLIKVSNEILSYSIHLNQELILGIIKFIFYQTINYY